MELVIPEAACEDTGSFHLWLVVVVQGLDAAS